jgi:hypothetical protein
MAGVLAGYATRQIDDDIETNVITVILQKLRRNTATSASGRRTKDSAVPGAFMPIRPETLIPVRHASVAVS